MELCIESNPCMKRLSGCISLPPEMILEMGAVEGQFLQVTSPTGELLLRIVHSQHPEQNTAWVAPETLERIGTTFPTVEIPEVTLGCDPEFFILWNQRRISAATYLPFIGEIGCDGELGELRPTYGRHESQVVETLGKLIPNIPSKLRRSSWASGLPEDGHSFSYEAHSSWSAISAGFHVHLGIPPEILNTRRDFNRAALTHIVRCLDWYVSVPLVPLEVNHDRRTGRSNYGRPGDYRTTNVTLEYRVPGAFYLRSPVLAGGLLGLALLVTENVIARLKEASRDFLDLPRLGEKELYQLVPIPPAAKVIETLTHSNTSLAQRELDNIIKYLEQLPSFEKHRPWVQQFFRAVDAQRRPGPNIVANWKENP